MSFSTAIEVDLWMIEDNKDAMAQASFEDLHKHPFEAVMELMGVQKEILQTLDKLDKWTAPEYPARTDFLNFMGGATVRTVPLGTALIIGAWNFPFSVVLHPAASAIDAGCTMLLKPSDVARASQKLLKELVPKYLDPTAIQVVTAGPSEMGYILQQRFDCIFFTGSANVGKIVYAAAAKHLTPVTLELGGQGPAIVCKSANIDIAAKRIASAKFMNSGQICLNVNHVLVDPSVREALVDRLIHYFDIFLGSKKELPEYYSTIINERNFDRLDNLLEKTDGKVLYSGTRNREAKFFGPTIVLIKPDDILMSEEIFGPILPIMDADLENALSVTASGEHPLALYGFTADAAEKERILERTQSGGVTFNDCFMHVAARDVPFGGVGNSGTGAYHGRYGILAFSHLRPHIEGLPSWMESLMWFRYPPYTLAAVEKVAPLVRPPFDRDGKDIKPFGWVKWGEQLAMLTSKFAR
ncbi:aldehyde dehydrogenase [Thozetella sp. PMI_491]|nr:aldehyde dehydrogenase [Thozetella sp. PMI_491]